MDGVSYAISAVSGVVYIAKFIIEPLVNHLNRPVCILNIHQNRHFNLTG